MGSAMSLSLKEGVRIQGLRSEIVLAIIIANGIYQNHDLDCTVTSIIDGKHSASSLHYTGCAFDLRTRNIPNTALQGRIRMELAQALGQDFDVLLEVDHIHVEYQPGVMTA